MKIRLIGLYLLFSFLYIGGFAQVYKINQDRYILQVSGTDLDGVKIKSSRAVDVIELGSLALYWSPEVKPSSCSYELVNEGEHQAIQATYRFPSNIPASLSMKGTFIAYPDRIDVRYDIAGVPDGYVQNWGGGQFHFALLNESLTEVLPETSLGLWERHSNGGLPIEKYDTKLIPFKFNKDLFSLAYGSDNPAISEWKDDWNRHTALVNNQDGSYSTSFSILVTSTDWPLEAASAQWQKRPFALALTSNHPYNWWDSNSSPLTVDVAIVNTSKEDRDVKLKYWVCDFSGNKLISESKDVKLTAQTMIVEPISFTASNQRDLFFVEVSIEDKNGVEQVFTRTNLSLLPPHNYSSLSAEKSIMGLSAYWEYPNKDELKRLLDRMGVRWLRYGNTNDYENLEAMYHNNIDWKKTWTDNERDEFIRNSFKEIIKNKNKIWEFGNELNMTSGGIAQGEDGIGKAVLAAPYVDWLKAIRKVQTENSEWEDIKIISFGLAGTDEVFIDKIVEYGGWNLLDGFALHPGRGNFTPDHPVFRPWNNWTKPNSNYPYWNYYGSIRHAKNVLNRYGGKDLYLTEIYALDFPNDWWNDSPRSSAENVVLSYALAAGEGVKNALYYQLFNSVWHNQLGIDHKDREYSFGLINRDLSFKPSLMAFCTIAETLDNAKFRGWINFPDTQNKNTKGMLFDTANGSVCILWDRTEGYVQTKQTSNYGTPEAWIPTWSGKVDITMPCEKAGLTTVNAIGQKSDLLEHNGTTSFSISGAPTIVYGVDASKIDLYYDYGASTENMIIENKIQLSPSVVKDHFIVDGELLLSKNEIELQIYNLYGKLVKASTIQPFGRYVSERIDVNDLGTGVYTVILDSKSYKIIKQ